MTRNVPDQGDQVTEFPDIFSKCVRIGKANSVTIFRCPRTNKMSEKCPNWHPCDRPCPNGFSYVVRYVAYLSEIASGVPFYERAGAFGLAAAPAGRRLLPQ